MDKRESEILVRVRKLCELAGIDTLNVLEDLENKLKNRIKELFTPNIEWFNEEKSLRRYWKFLENLTGHEWEYKDVDYWYKLLRNPSEKREEIPSSLRYQVLIRDKSTCQKCGSKAPDVKLEIDHIFPWSSGGPTVLDNLHTLCKRCNRGKSNRYFERNIDYAK